jgi:hypothetical protein
VDVGEVIVAVSGSAAAAIGAVAGHVAVYVRDKRDRDRAEKAAQAKAAHEERIARRAEERDARREVEQLYVDAVRVCRQLSTMDLEPASGDERALVLRLKERAAELHARIQLLGHEQVSHTIDSWYEDFLGGSAINMRNALRAMETNMRAHLRDPACFEAPEDGSGGEPERPELPASKRRRPLLVTSAAAGTRPNR